MEAELRLVVPLAMVPKYVVTKSETKRGCVEETLLKDGDRDTDEKT